MLDRRKFVVVLICTLLSHSTFSSEEKGHLSYVKLYDQWEAVVEKAHRDGRSTITFVDMDLRKKLGEGAWLEVPFLKGKLEHNSYVVFILDASQQLVAFSKQRGLNIEEGDLSEKGLSRWGKILDEWIALNKSKNSSGDNFE